MSDGELVDDQKFVVARFVPVNQPDLLALTVTVLMDF